LSKTLSISSTNKAEGRMFAFDFAQNLSLFYCNQNLQAQVSQFPNVNFLYKAGQGSESFDPKKIVIISNGSKRPSCNPNHISSTSETSKTQMNRLLIEVFSRKHILFEKELRALYEIRFENCLKMVQIEGRYWGRAFNHIVPIAI